MTHHTPDPQFAGLSQRIDEKGERLRCRHCSNRVGQWHATTCVRAGLRVLAHHCKPLDDPPPVKVGEVRKAGKRSKEEVEAALAPYERGAVEEFKAKLLSDDVVNRAHRIGSTADPHLRPVNRLVIRSAIEAAIAEAEKAGEGNG